MSKEGNNKSYNWLLHLAIWGVLFGMPFFSPRPGHPLNEGVDYSRFLLPFVAFLFVFYVNYFILIKRYLFERKYWTFIAWNIVLVSIVSVLVHTTFIHVFPMPHGKPMRPRSTLGNIGFVARNTFVYLGIICVAVAIRMTQRWNEEESRRKEMEKSATEAELAALKSQVNPHFLFNTLNNIYSLIQIDQDKAQDAVHNLSGMLRYVLYESEKPFVPLRNECDFLKDYIKLMSMRCSPEVRIEASLPDCSASRVIAPLLFLPLVENAFKHGISPGCDSHIRIELEEDGNSVSFLVENSFFPKDDSDRSGSGIGVKNLCRRLDMLYPGLYTFEYGKTEDSYRSFLRINTENK